MKKRLRKKLAIRYNIVCGQDVFGLLWRKDWEERTQAFFQLQGKEAIESLDRYAGYKCTSKYVFLSMHAYKGPVTAANADTPTCKIGRVETPCRKYLTGV